MSNCKIPGLEFPTFEFEFPPKLPGIELPFPPFPDIGLDLKISLEFPTFEFEFPPKLPGIELPIPFLCPLD